MSFKMLSFKEYIMESNSETIVSDEFKEKGATERWNGWTTTDSVQLVKVNFNKFMNVIKKVLAKRNISESSIIKTETKDNVLFVYINSSTDLLGDIELMFNDTSILVQSRNCTFKDKSNANLYGTKVMCYKIAQRYDEE